MRDINLLRLLMLMARCETGAAAVEYSLIAFAMFGAIIPAFIYVADAMGVKFANVTDYFSFD